MKCEIESAANFLSSMLKLHSNVLTTEQLDRFKDAIEIHLQNQYQHHWFPDKPTKGSGYRCIRINHKLDPILSKAGQSCGIDSHRLSTIFPNELTLWVDPQEVSYRIGENGSICVLFDGRTGDANSNLAIGEHKNSPSNKQHQQMTDSGRGHRNVINVNRHQHQQQIRSAGTGRFSPTDSTLSSSTSTMSSPSPSSSPDWCRMSYDRHSSPENWVKNQGTMVQMNSGAFTDHHHHHNQHTSMHHQVQQQPQHTLTNGHHASNIRRSSPISVMGFGSGSTSAINGGGPSSLEGVSLYNGFHHSAAPTLPFAFNHGVVNGNNGTNVSGTNVSAVLRTGTNGVHNASLTSQQQAAPIATGPNQSGHFNAAFTNGWGSPYRG